MEQAAEMTSEARRQVGGKVSGIFGGASGGVGTFGALHDVCHYTCQIVVTGLGIVGISLTGLPLAFLEDPKLVAFFGGMGIVSLGTSMTLHMKAKRWSFRAAGPRGFFDRKMAVLLVFLLLSVWSVTQGATQMMRVATAADAPTQVNKDGNVEVELTLVNLKDSTITDALAFELTMNSMDMSAPSFQTYDLKQAITLETDGGVSVRPAEISISDWGHMGHHLRGRLTFPQNVAGTSLLKSKVLRVTIRGIGGVEKRVLEWRTPR